jgi:hypothetical protein
MQFGKTIIQNFHQNTEDLKMKLVNGELQHFYRATKVFVMIPRDSREKMVLPLQAM